jgi:hypothetical protein
VLARDRPQPVVAQSVLGPAKADSKAILALSKTRLWLSPTGTPSVVTVSVAQKAPRRGGQRPAEQRLPFGEF